MNDGNVLHCCYVGADSCVFFNHICPPNLSSVLFVQVSLI